MIMFIIHNIKWGKSNKLALKIEPIIFTTTSISKMLMPSCYKLTKNHTKTFEFTTLDTSRRKELMIMKTFTVGIHCIYLLIMQIDILKKKI